MFYNIKKKNYRDFKNIRETGYERMKTALLSDTNTCSSRVHNVIRSDFYSMIINYMDVSPEKIELDIDCDEEGNYILSIRATAKRILSIGVPPAN